jgi:hypothetical protein
VLPSVEWKIAVMMRSALALAALRAAAVPGLMDMVGSMVVTTRLQVQHDCQIGS